jgi:hypothetical protein
LLNLLFAPPSSLLLLRSSSFPYSLNLFIVHPSILFSFLSDSFPPFSFSLCLSPS